MQSQAELLSLMDMVDLDEEVVDERLKTIMDRSTWTDRHLQTAITLLKYKQLINIQEKSDCVNKLECNFVAKLTSIVDPENIDYVCNIIELVLSLNTKQIVSNSEHLVQQFLCNIDLLVRKVNNESLVEAESTEILQSFLLCESVFDALSESGEKMTLLFLETPLENVLCFGDEMLKVHFLTTTVPKLFDNVIGYNILDRVWTFIKESNNAMDMDNALKCLSCLSEFFLPIPDSKGQKRFESSIVKEFEFWQLLCSGLHSDDSSIRKISAYLIKRSIDCVISCNSDFTVHSSSAEIIFSWKQENKKQQKQMWDNFFILLDSLDEKQTNIVLPSLKLFENLDGIQDIWVNCAFKLGLTHDSILVRLKCIEYRLLLSFKSDSEAVTLLEALNDISLYENDNDIEQLKQKLLLSLNNIKTFGILFKCIPMIKWASIPLYHISNILKSLNFQLDQIEHDESFEKQQITETIKAILKIPCNNVTMRNAVCINISHFVGNLNNFLTWEDVCHISLCFDVEYLQKNYFNPFIELLKNVTIPVSDSEKFMKTITSSSEYIELSLLFLHNKQFNKEYFIKDVEDKIAKITNIVNRQYSNKLECFNHFIYILSLFNKTVGKSHDVENTIHCVHVIIAREFKTLLRYMFCLLSDDLILNVDELKMLFFQIESITYEQDDYLDVLLQIYKAAVLSLSHEETETHKKAFSIHVLYNVFNDAVFKDYYRHEILNLSQLLKLVNNIKLKDINSESNGRLRCIFYEKCCEVVYKMLELSNRSQNIKEIIDFIDNVIECGGYGCLLWILRIVNDIFPNLIECIEINYNIPQFVDRMWKEIEELKSNNQYSPCIEEFVNLITHDTLLKEPMYNNVITLYCDKIIEYGSVKNTPLYYLARNINNMKITVDHGQIVYILSKLLLYSPVPRKDQRIAENLVVEILREDRLTFEKNIHAIFITLLHQKEGNVSRAIDVHFNYEIQYLTISTLCKISNPVLYDMIISLITSKIDECFKNKQRYHGNSQLHRTLLIGVQHVLLIGLLNWKTFEDEKTLHWSTEMLTRLPHQPSVRICLEWIISLCFLVKKYDLNCELVNMMKSKNISISSQFSILYGLLKHKMANAISKTDEYEFVMDTLLAHTMGQMFNVRLHAQYFAAKLHRKGRNGGKYAYIIEVINKTFTEGAKDKNFIKLSEDIFVNDFDIIGNLTPTFIYYFLPRYCDVGCNENVDEAYIKEILRNINEHLAVRESENDFQKTWQKSRVTDDHIFTHKLSKDLETNIVIDDTEAMGTIQKKYIPWKNMTDINVYETGKKRDSQSELIVVASLINKLPNLGGMARTGEVFGVKTFIVDSLRHLQDKQFQGLSVSAERWVDIQEVRPGAPLKEYLMRMKDEGYSVVAAEQTSTSCKLQTFKFPKKTLLLLGHEKEGVPCDLLPLMDYCIEIPQQGFVRSLNVHVTAAIFIWEYTRQNIL